MSKTERPPSLEANHVSVSTCWMGQEMDCSAASRASSTLHALLRIVRPHYFFFVIFSHISMSNIIRGCLIRQGGRLSWAHRHSTCKNSIDTCTYKLDTPKQQKLCRTPSSEYLIRHQGSGSSFRFGALFRPLFICLGGSECYKATSQQTLPRRRQQAILI